MRGIGVSTIAGLVVAGLWLMSGCSNVGSKEPVRPLQIQQAWELQPGDTVAGRRITGSLGDISIELNGSTVYAPFDGRLQPIDVQDCFVFSSPEVPAYLFRLCGLKRPQLGPVRQGDAIGSGDYLQFAALRRQPDGKWAMVEPASDILERTLNRPQ